jgi:hypothetical protein
MTEMRQTFGLEPGPDPSWKKKVEPRRTRKKKLKERAKVFEGEWEGGEGTGRKSIVNK